MKRFIFIEGGIGVGKSTLLSENRIINHKNITKIYREPLEIWTPYLDRFYKDRQNTTLIYELQVVILNSLKSILNEAMDHPNKNGVYLFERSIYSAFFVFTNLNQIALGEAYYLDIKNLFEQIDAQIVTWINAQQIFVEAVLIKVPEAKQLEYLTKRNRLYDDTIPLDYHRSVIKNHENLIQILKLRKIPVHQIINDTLIDDEIEKFEKCIFGEKKTYTNL